VVKCDTTRFSEHPFSRILRRHEILSNYARDLHSGNGGLPDKIAEIGICYYEELEFWRIFCLKTGLGSAFNGASIYSCDMLESKFRAIPKSVSAKYLSDLRFFYKELILIAISSIMIIGDTTCRASLCSLALTHSDDSFGQVIGMYREIILDRASKYLGIECI